jgi:hypothetical protein
MKEISIYYNFMSEDEKNYIKSLIDDQSKWVWRTKFDELNGRGQKLWYDSIFPEYDKLKEYHKKITDNGKFIVAETALNIIQKNRQIIGDAYHTDSGNLSYCTYFNDDFTGGRFFYINDLGQECIIDPKPNLTIKINSGIKHRVENVYNGIRYSLYTFLKYPDKNKKSIL